MLPLENKVTGGCELILGGCCISTKSELKSSSIMKVGGHVQ